MNRMIRGEGIDGRQVLHAEEIAAGDWRAVDLERNAGICIYQWESLITRIADLIGAGHIYSLSTGPDAFINRVFIDRAGNIWLDHQYLAPSQYLPRLIPEHAIFEARP